MSAVDRGFDTAFAASTLSDAPRAGLRMGAAIYGGSRLLAVGCNLYSRSHPESEQSCDFWRSTHAEHTALLKRQHYPNGSMTLYVARRRADGSIGCSKPCANCIRLCKLAGIARIWFYNYEGKPEDITL